ncbi:MAG: hypothetical protein IMY76_01530 [Chloroflexi bacterium]|nr:hypothetical protein [Chloroflexota bacterium]
MDLREQRDQQHYQAALLVRRLARLSADSTWARRASGVRAAIDKALSKTNEQNSTHLGSLIESGFALLENAAREIQSPEDILLGLHKRKTSEAEQD